MDKNTFGNTPAAQYLARELARIGTPALTRSVGRRITSTNNIVNDLLYAYDAQAISTKTLANSLRLMREEVSIEYTEYLVDQLRKNVQIGLIKRGLRLATISRKSERVMQNPEYRSSEREVLEVDGGIETHYKFRDSNSGKMYSAGMVFHSDGTELFLANDGDVFIAHHEQSDVDDITPELLHERSDRRCLRQGKPHMTWVAPAGIDIGRIKKEI